MIARLSSPPTAADLSALHTLLRDAVESNASVGFMLPLTEEEISTYWSGVLATVASGTRLLLVTRDDAGRIVGSVQLELVQKTNAPHRCELQKLLVLRPHRGRRLGYALMQAAEDAARAAHRTLIILDTSSTGNALNLYDRCGYTRSGTIPRYATDPDGTMISTVFYYKELSALAPAAPIATPAAAPLHHLAQVNIARLLAPLDSPAMSGFVSRLDEINALGDRSPGFVWRFQSDAGNATYLRPYDDDRIIFNLTVWETPAALKNFVYRGDHAKVFAQRAQWFEHLQDAILALWWIPAGHLPTVEEAKQRLEHLRTHGPTSHAFTFRQQFPPAAP